MAFHLPQIFTPTPSQTSSPRVIGGPNKFHTPSQFSYQSMQQPQQNDQLDSLDRLSQKRMVPLLQLPSINNGSFEATTPKYASHTDRSPMYMGNANSMPMQMPMPMSMHMPMPMPIPMTVQGPNSGLDPRLMNNPTGRSSIFLQMKRNGPSINTNEVASPSRGSLLRTSTLQDTTPQARSYSSNARPVVQRQDSFSDRAMPYVQREQQSAASIRRESSFKKVYDISIKDSKSQFASYEQQAFEKQLEKQSTILTNIASKMDDPSPRPTDLENYKTDIDNQIKQLQQKKMMVDMELKKRVSMQIRHERYDSEPDRRAELSENGSDGSATHKPSKKNKFQERMIKQITMARQHSVNQGLEDIDSEYSSLGDGESGNITPYGAGARVKTQPNERTDFGFDLEKELGNFKIEPKRPDPVRRALKHSDSYDPAKRGSLRAAVTRNAESSGDETPRREHSSNKTESDFEEEKTPVKKALGSKMLSVFAKKQATKERGSFKVDVETEESETEKKPSLPKRRIDEARRKKAQMRIQSMTWIMVSIKILFNESRRKAVAKKSVMDEKIIDKLLPTKKMMKEFAIRVAGKEIITMLTTKQIHPIFVSNKPMIGKKLDKECIALKDQLKTIITKLTQNISALPKQFFDFLKTISEEGSVLPSYYFSDFELNRLKFTYFGCLKYVQPNQSKLILGGITLIRVFTHTILMQPWEAFFDPNHPNDEDTAKDRFNIERLLNIGSLLYNVVMEMFKEVPINRETTNVSFEMKVHPKRRLPRAICDEAESAAFEIRKDLYRDGEIISDFYPKQQLSCFFSDRKGLVKELKEAVQGWLDALYDRTHQCEIMVGSVDQQKKWYINN